MHPLVDNRAFLADELMGADATFRGGLQWLSPRSELFGEALDGGKQTADVKNVEVSLRLNDSLISLAVDGYDPTADGKESETIELKLSFPALYPDHPLSAAVSSSHPSLEKTLQEVANSSHYESRVNEICLQTLSYLYARRAQVPRERLSLSCEEEDDRVQRGDEDEERVKLLTSYKQCLDREHEMTKMEHTCNLNRRRTDSERSEPDTAAVNSLRQGRFHTKSYSISPSEVKHLTNFKLLLKDSTVNIGRWMASGSSKASHMTSDLDTGEIRAAHIWELSPHLFGTKFKAMKKLHKIQQEVAALSSMSHPNLVQLHSMSIQLEGSMVHVKVLTANPNGTPLKKIISTENSLTACAVQKYARGMTRGLSFLHENRIAHKSLTEDAVHIRSDGTVRLTDYGFVQPLDDMLLGGESVKQPLSYWFKQDVWSLGRLTYCLTFGEMSERLDVDYLESLPSNLKEFLLRTFVDKETERIKSTTLLEHPYISHGFSGTPHSNRIYNCGDRTSSFHGNSTKLLETTKMGREFKNLDVLHRGKFSSVIKVENVLDSRHYAVYQIFLPPGDKELEEGVRKEVQFLSGLDHVNVVRYYTFWLQPSIHKTSLEESQLSFSSAIDNSLGEADSGDDVIRTLDLEGLSSNSSPGQLLCVQMDFYEDITLRTAIDEGLYYKEERMWRLMRELLQGLDHIHTMGLVHRDLHPSSVFLDQGGAVKIGDFGLTPSAVHGLSCWKGAGVCSENLQLYTCPESIINSEWNEDPVLKFKADMYSLGIVLYEMCTKPLGSSEERRQVLGDLRSDPPVFPEAFSQSRANRRKEQLSLISLLLSHNAADRPTAAEILSENYLPAVKMEEERLTTAISTIVADSESEIYKELMSKLFAQDDASVDHTGGDGQVEDRGLSSSQNSLMTTRHAFGRTCSHILDTCSLQGAVPAQFPVLNPRSRALVDRNAAAFLNKSGRLQQLPITARVPFAQYVAEVEAVDLTRCSTGRVYRQSKADRTHSSHPQGVWEGTFDVIAPLRINPAIAGSMSTVRGVQDLTHVQDARVLATAIQVVRAASSPSSSGTIPLNPGPSTDLDRKDSEGANPARNTLGSFHLKISHMGLVRAVFESCGVEKDRMDIAIEAAADTMKQRRSKGMKVASLVDKLNLRRSMAERLYALLTISTHSVSDIEERLLRNRLFKSASQASVDIRKALSHISRVLSLCDTAGVLLTVTADLLYDTARSSGIIFQINESGELMVDNERRSQSPYCRRSGLIRPKGSSRSGSIGRSNPSSVGSASGQGSEVTEKRREGRLLVSAYRYDFLIESFMSRHTSHGQLKVGGVGASFVVHNLVEGLVKSMEVYSKVMVCPDVRHRDLSAGLSSVIGCLMSAGLTTEVKFPLSGEACLEDMDEYCRLHAIPTVVLLKSLDPDHITLRLDVGGHWTEQSVSLDQLESTIKTHLDDKLDEDEQDTSSTADDTDPPSPLDLPLFHTHYIELPTSTAVKKKLDNQLEPTLMSLWKFVSEGTRLELVVLNTNKATLIRIQMILKLTPDQPVFEKSLYKTIAERTKLGLAVSKKLHHLLETKVKPNKRKPPVVLFGSVDQSMVIVRW